MTDIRPTKTKQNIENAFINLLNEKELHAITVENICKKALTSRSTFYLHYLDKYDLLAQVVDTQILVFEQIVKKRLDGLISGHFEETIVQFYNELTDRQLIIQTLFSIDEPGYNLKNKFENILYQYWLKYLINKSNSRHNELIAKFGASIVFDTLNWTFEHGIDNDTLSFVENIRKKLLDMSSSLK
ncbi:TetR/AcrR family transcriptional regulator [Leuconostoc carnosum]|uniref:TetR/AcrR family transcriptional regulator n=1 Tax=Leuconostoc carnosum TaxID=1252 RepID=A0AAE6IIZ1_LEUCA|nr:TetR family transcriptional regulator [Leuconostoc carnosum]KAA8328339.1 TetR/AcrR family transcriptional regulator [Leuconostoc carnosum]QEA32773.1 TetR/AcrR family transcriptional regulator [Leuconostoc carnosum]